MGRLKNTALILVIQRLSAYVPCGSIFHTARLKEKMNESHSEEVALCTCVSAGEGVNLQNLALREARHMAHT